MPLDPVYQEMLKQMAAAGGPAMTDVSPPEAREMYRGLQAAAYVADIKHIEDRDANGIKIRIYRDTMEKTPCIVYFHGGGWVIGDLDTHDTICTQLAAETGYAVISVDYRLAPENPFPAPIDDCYDGLCWIAANAVELNIDPEKIAVAGDSAGGNLAAAACIKARDQGQPAIAFQALFYPVTDVNFDTGSYHENAEGYFLTREGMQWFWDHYIGQGEANRKNPLAAPLQASDFSGLPAAQIMTAEFDPLRDEGESYARALSDAGVAVEVKRYDGMIHGFFGATDVTQGARDAMADAVRALKAALG